MFSTLYTILSELQIKKVHKSVEKATFLHFFLVGGVHRQNVELFDTRIANFGKP